MAKEASYQKLEPEGETASDTDRDDDYIFRRSGASGFSRSRWTPSLRPALEAVLLLIILALSVKIILGDGKLPRGQNEPPQTCAYLYDILATHLFNLVPFS